MTVLSVIKRPVAADAFAFLKGLKNGQDLWLRNISTSLIRSGQEQRLFKITPGRYQWQQYKDLFHFYLFLGVIPLTTFVFLVNIFIGPATLCEIPEGYVPKYYEYHRHPISRWISRYYQHQSPQQAYERNMHYFEEEDIKRRMRLLSWRVEALMNKRHDYPNYYGSTGFRSKYLRSVMDDSMETHGVSGYIDHGGDD